jgi:poly [ADP-ribose] polymerase
MTATTAAAVTRQILLVKTDARANSNKFYEIALLANGDVESRWGRVGTPGQVTPYPGGGALKFGQLEAEKTRKGYQRVDPGATAGAGVPLQAAARAALSDGNPATDDLIARLAAVNHRAIEVTSSGRITATASGVQTALGPVSAATIARARAALAGASAGNLDMVDRYLMLVPQDLGRRRGWHDQFTEPAFQHAQREFLDQLDAAVAITPAGGGAASFRHRLTALDPGHADMARLGARLDATRNHHHADSVTRLRLARAWALTDTAAGRPAAAVGAGQAGGPPLELWHGSDPANQLSILYQGLIVPPRTGADIPVNGRLFGDGIYLSEQSTKSLQYSAGTSYGSPAQGRCYLLAARVTPGRTLRTTSADTRQRVLARMRADGYDTLWVSPGTCGVYNNEVIVPDPSRVTLGYLLELQ